jgi:hypothetical protein
MTEMEHTSEMLWFLQPKWDDGQCPIYISVQMIFAYSTTSFQLHRCTVMEVMWKEVIMVNFNVLSQYLRGETEKNHERNSVKRGGL